MTTNNGVANPWETYSYVYGDGMRALISFDVVAAREAAHRDHLHCVRLIIYVDPPQLQRNGLPVAAVVPPLNDMEDALVSQLRNGRVDCRQVGRMTYGGLRELVFQVGDKTGFRNGVARWRTAYPDRKIEVREREGWTFFDEKVKPKPAHWQQIGDRQVIDQLVRAGSDPQARHVLEHTFVGPPAALRKIAEQLAADGFEQRQLEGEMLMMARPCRLDLDQVSGLTGALLSFSQSLGACYDGWGAAVVPPPADR